MTPTKKPKPAAPIVITAPGEYVRRDGRRTMVRLLDPGHPRWRWWSDDSGWHDDSGVFNLPDSAADDIVAKAPALSARACPHALINPEEKCADCRDLKKPRPFKGKKAKRRYVVRRQYWPQTSWMVCDATVTDSDGDIAQGMTRADARMFAAMKEAQRGGA